MYFLLFLLSPQNVKKTTGFVIVIADVTDLKISWMNHTTIRNLTDVV